MRNVPEWLAELGLARYADAFAKNDIEFRTLPYLTDQDLKDLGLTLGHRRIVLTAIERIHERPAPDLALEAKPIRALGPTLSRMARCRSERTEPLSCQRSPP